MATPLSINTNVGSLNAQRNVASGGRALNQSIERLSSGLKINSAADDAAGIAVSEGLRHKSADLSKRLRMRITRMRCWQPLRVHKIRFQTS